MKRLILVGAAVMAGALGALSYIAWWPSEPWLVAGTWQPTEPIWPEPKLRFDRPSSTVYGRYTPPRFTATTTPEGWQITPPANIRLFNAIEATKRRDAAKTRKEVEDE